MSMLAILAAIAKCIGTFDDIDRSVALRHIKHDGVTIKVFYNDAGEWLIDLPISVICNAVDQLPTVVLR